MDRLDELKSKRIKISIIDKILFLLLILCIAITYKYLIAVIPVFILSMIISNNKNRIQYIDENLKEIEVGNSFNR